MTLHSAVDHQVFALMSRNACNGENGEKSPEVELDTKRGPLEAGDFGENRQRTSDNGDKRPGLLETGDFGKNSQRVGDIQNVAKYSNWMPKVAPSK